MEFEIGNVDDAESSPDEQFEQADRHQRTMYECEVVIQQTDEGLQVKHFVDAVPVRQIECDDFHVYPAQQSRERIDSRGVRPETSRGEKSVAVEPKRVARFRGRVTI